MTDFIDACIMVAGALVLSAGYILFTIIAFSF